MTVKTDIINVDNIPSVPGYNISVDICLLCMYLEIYKSIENYECVR